MTNDDVVSEMARVVGPLPARQQSLRMSEGCVLAEDLYSPVDIPPAPTATRDGYAVRSADVLRAGKSCVLQLLVKPAAPSDEDLCEHTVRPVLTGGPLPSGADAVISQEDVRGVTGPRGACVEVIGGVRAGQHVFARGGEVAKGARVIAAGTRLGPPELALAAAIGVRQLSVVPRPRVGVIITGSELRQTALDEGLRASNAVLLEAMVRACGGTVATTEVVRDDHDALAAAFDRAMGCDIILSTGGTGRGSADLVRGALRERESFSMWDVSSCGSRPVSFRTLHTGRGGHVAHMALPGRPVAAAVAFALFALPLLRRLAGYAALLPRYCVATLEPNVSTTQRFLPVRLEHRGQYVHAKASADASLYGLRAAMEADGFALMPRAGDTGALATVRVLLPPWSERACCFAERVPAASGVRQVRPDAGCCPDDSVRAASASL